MRRAEIHLHNHPADEAAVQGRLQLCRLRQVRFGVPRAGAAVGPDRAPDARAFTALGVHVAARRLARHGHRALLPIAGRGCAAAPAAAAAIAATATSAQHAAACGAQFISFHSLGRGGEATRSNSGATLQATTRTASLVTRRSFSRLATSRPLSAPLPLPFASTMLFGARAGLESSSPHKSTAGLFFRSSITVVLQRTEQYSMMYETAWRWAHALARALTASSCACTACVPLSLAGELSPRCLRRQ